MPAMMGSMGASLPPMGAAPMPAAPQFPSLDPMALAEQIMQIMQQIASGDSAQFAQMQDAAMQQVSPMVMAMLGGGAPAGAPMGAPPADASLAQVEGPPVDDLALGAY